MHKSSGICASLKNQHKRGEIQVPRCLFLNTKQFKRYHIRFSQGNSSFNWDIFPGIFSSWQADSHPTVTRSTARSLRAVSGFNKFLKQITLFLFSLICTQFGTRSISASCKEDPLENSFTPKLILPQSFLGEDAQRLGQLNPDLPQAKHKIKQEVQPLHAHSTLIQQEQPALCDLFMSIPWLKHCWAQALGRGAARKTSG